MIFLLFFLLFFLFFHDSFIFFCFCFFENLYPTAATKCCIQQLPPNVVSHCAATKCRNRDKKNLNFFQGAVSGYKNGSTRSPHLKFHKTMNCKITGEVLNIRPTISDWQNSLGQIKPYIAVA